MRCGPVFKKNKLFSLAFVYPRGNGPPPFSVPSLEFLLGQVLAGLGVLFHAFFLPGDWTGVQKSPSESDGQSHSEFGLGSSVSFGSRVISSLASRESPPAGSVVDTLNSTMVQFMSEPLSLSSLLLSAPKHHLCPSCHLSFPSVGLRGRGFPAAETNLLLSEITVRCFFSNLSSQYLIESTVSMNFQSTSRAGPPARPTVNLPRRSIDVSSSICRVAGPFDDDLSQLPNLVSQRSDLIAPSTS